MLIWRVVHGVLLVYMLLLMLRIMLSWFRRTGDSGASQLLVRVTEPYLSFFRQFRALRLGLLDLSPIAAILVLVVALDLVGALQAFGRLTVGIFLSALVGALWSGVSFLIVLVLIIVVVLILMLTLGQGYASPLAQTMASLVRPVVAFVGGLIARLFSPRRALGEVPALVLTAVLLVVLLIVGRALTVLLRPFLLNLPF